MLYKFKSKETSDLLMLEPHARQILTIIGKEASAQGIVLAEEMALAIQRLQDAVQAEEIAATQAKQTAAQKPQAEPSNDSETQSDARANNVSLKQRATPFIDMLKRANAAHVEVVWGV